MNDVEKIVEMLNAGRVVAFPTDTVFALACNATNEDAIKKIYELKNRDYSKPLAIFVKDFDELEKISKPNKFLKKFKNEVLSGKLTVIVEKNDDVGLMDSINVKNNTIGVRIPNHELVRAILEKFGKPIAATSVNLSGQKEALTRADVERYFGNKIDFIADGDCGGGVPSTVISLVGDKVEVVREGAMKIDNSL
jgi:L-threonylcarbamoyladenylate synthase